MGDQLQLRCVPEVSQQCFPGLSEQWPKLDPGGPFIPKAKLTGPNSSLE